MPVVGTAGHVDHGKSTLVQALTGRDPDRWAEEKRRGLTIDLGFSWTELSTGVEVGFVDVPGHERFIKNMLAGVDGIDVALLVVAADEGWMPQSEEHLAVLDLLDVRHGVVALTRVDLADRDMVELAALEVHEKLAETSLEDAPIIEVAAPTGFGIEEVRSALAEAVDAAGPVSDWGRPRLWVDRSFTIGGAGTVVTGTLVGGSIEIGDELTVWPGLNRGRVRSLQSHERPMPSVAPGNRTAANLAGLDRAQINRGAMLGRLEHWKETDTALVQLRSVRYLDEPLTDRGAYHLHIGSGAWPVRLRLLGITESGDQMALLRLGRRLPLTMGDRFILRDVGRRIVAGGGRIIDPRPARRGAAAREAFPLLHRVVDDSPDDRAQVLLEVRRRSSVEELAADSGGGLPKEGVLAGGVALSATEADRLVAQAGQILAEFHKGNPLRPGMPKASLASTLGLTIQQAEAVIAGAEEISTDGTTVRRADFGGGWGSDQETAWRAASEMLRGSGLAAPRASQLDLDRETLHALIRDGRLVRISDDLVYLPEHIDETRRRLDELEDGFSVAQFRDSLGVTRRHAIPLLEHFDRAGITVREGDLRRVRRSQPDGRGADDDPPR